MHATRWLPAALALAVLLAPAALADWPQFRHDDERSGVGDVPGAIRAEFQEWVFEADGPIEASPAVTAVAGETTIVVGSYPAQSTPGTVYALTPSGEERWSTTPAGSTGGYVASPTVEDLDGDGAKEVVLPSLDDSTLRVFDAADGTQEWSDVVGNSNEDLLASSPVVADLDADDGKEIALGGSLPDHAGSLLIYDADGERLQAIELDGPAWSSPLHEDADGDGTRELYVATGVPDEVAQLFPGAKTGGGSLFKLERSGSTWSIAWRTQLSGPSMATPTAGDLDGDGTPEVVLGARGGHLYAIDPDTGAKQADATAGVGDLAAVSSPAIADVDHDGALEVVYGRFDGLQAQQLTADGWSRDGALHLPGAGPDGDQDPWVAASPAVQDVDGDDRRDVVAATVPVDVADPIVESDALPGRVFAVNGSRLAEADTPPLFAFPLPDDGSISGPALADLDGDGRSEVLAGEGIPVIGNGSALHALDAANPVVEGIQVAPEEPTDLDDVAFAADLRDEDTPEDDVTREWSFGDGATATGTEPTHRYADDGTYTVTVTARDPDGHDWRASREVQVRNVPPDVGAEVSTTPGSLEVVLDGEARDPDGTVEAVRWATGDGTTADREEITHTYPTGGTYEARFTARDDDGDASTVERAVSVNRFPSLDGPDRVDATEGQALEVALSWGDPDGDPVHVEALEGPEGLEASVGPDAVTLTWTPPFDVATRSTEPVPVDVRVRVQDGGAPAGNATHEFLAEVANANRAPIVGAPGTATASTGHETAIRGELGDPDGNPVTLEATGLPASAELVREPDAWRVDVDPPLGAGASTHEVAIAADDGLDRTSRSFTLEVVPNRPPDVAVRDPGLVQPDTRWAPNPVELDGTDTTDPEGDPIAAWTWTVEGRRLGGPVVEHAFDEGGTYDVELEAGDELGAAASASVPVAVDDALTGDLVVHQAGSDPASARTVVLEVAYDDGTPLARHPVDVQLRHEGLDRTTARRTVRTDADGLALARFEGELGLPVFLPGPHEVLVEAEADSRPGAALQDVETVQMDRAFRVG